MSSEEKDFATLPEIEEALNSLSDSDLNRIKKEARSLAALYWFCSKGRDEDDLMQIAFERVLTLKRKWSKSKVDFVRFILGTVRSVANHWVEEKGAGLEVQSQILQTDEGDVLDQMENSPSHRTSPEDELNDQIGKMTHEKLVEWIDDFFKDDTPVQLVMLELLESKKGPEIQESFGIDQTEYQTIIKRMDRKLAKEGIKWRRHVR